MKKIRTRVGAGQVGAVMFLGMVLLACKFVGGGKSKTQIEYSELGLDPKSADADAMIQSVTGRARKWKRDATFWEASFNAVRGDGTVDLSAGASKVRFVSPKHAQSALAKQRKDALKEFKFQANHVKIGGKIRAKKRWKNFYAPTPTCTIKQLTASLAERGLTGSKTVRIRFDPRNTGKFVKQDAWRVQGEDPKIDAYYSLKTCELIKDRLAR